MHMIGLDSQFYHLPTLFTCYFVDDLFQSLQDLPIQHVSPSLGAPDHMIDDEVNTVTVVLIVHAGPPLHLRRITGC